MRVRWAMASALGDTGSAGGDHWPEAGHVADPGREPEKRASWLALAGLGWRWLWANEGRGSAKQEAAVHSARPEALPIRAAGQDDAALALAATSSPVSQQRKREGWISVKAKLASFGHKIRQRRRRREKKRGRDTYLREGPPLNQICFESYGGTSTLPCSRVVAGPRTVSARRVPLRAGTVALCRRYGRRHSANSKLSGTLIGPTKYLPGTVSPVLPVLAVPVPGPAVVSAPWLVYCTNPSRLRLLQHLPAVGLRDLYIRSSRVRGWP